MNSEYFYDYVDSLERILSVAQYYNYSTKALERHISYSPFFQSIEVNIDGLSPFINDYLLTKTLFPEIEVDIANVPEYVECLWAAEAYLHIQLETRLTFEAIFIYLPISKMYQFFLIYHEMDFSHIVQEFKNIYLHRSIFAVLLDRYQYSLVYVSEQTKIPYDTLYSLKKRRRDAKKVNVESVVKLARLFNVRLETFAEMKI